MSIFNTEPTRGHLLDLSCEAAKIQAGLMGVARLADSASTTDREDQEEVLLQIESLVKILADAVGQLGEAIEPKNMIRWVEGVSDEGR